MSRDLTMADSTCAVLAVLSCGLSLIAPASVWAADAPRTIDADVCVYGGTSGGVMAAVQAARMGKQAVIAEPGRHLGGMTAGGLSAVDIGDPRSVGGIARECFTRLVGSYGRPWRGTVRS
jgi:NADPH-dependent 2,4-dienoyl-CoA reductase/sulfur reductase-like enzyme